MRIVLVEDFVMFRQVMHKVCTADFGYDVVGETGSGRLAIDLILMHNPDLVLLDLVLPEIDGFAVFEAVRKQSPMVRFLAISAYADPYTLYRVEKCGMHGYINKSTDTVEALHRALSVLENGGHYYSADYLRAREARQSESHFSKVLSEWECTILTLIGHGLSDTEIANQLELSPQTVQSHRSHMLRKLNLGGTPKLIAFATEHGFVRPIC